MTSIEDRSLQDRPSSLIERRQSLFYNSYLFFVGLAGILLLAWGVAQFPDYTPKLNFVLLAILAIVSAFVNTTVPVGNTGINYSIGSAITLASVPTFGIGGGVVMVSIINLATWFIKSPDRTWKRSWPQLAFNVGMCNIAVMVAGPILLFFRDLFGMETIAGETLPWLIGGYIFEELNFWMVALIVWLQHGKTIRLGDMWREDFWATQIGSMVTSVGGGVVAFAMHRYDAIGIVIFFVPILLSAYAFRLYVRQMQAHLDNLENIVAERTKELKKSTEELAIINQQKDTYLSVLTHDMMTPLGNIQFCNEAILEDESISQESHQLSQLALRSQQMLYNLVRNVLDLEKLQVVGTLPMHRTSFDVAETLDHLIEMMQLEAEAKNITLRHTIHRLPLPLHADRQQIERILLNLISNAIKYTHTGGSVDVNAMVDGGQIVFEIADTGYGIPPEELPYIFERFRRVKQLEDKASGTGLGLAITKALAEHHGGSITVWSERGKGSKFTVRLPADLEKLTSTTQSANDD